VPALYAHTNTHKSVSSGRILHRLKLLAAFSVPAAETIKERAIHVGMRAVHTCIACLHKHSGYINVSRGSF
jgi:hypothetical protein